jgi:hypothetical protein
MTKKGRDAVGAKLHLRAAMGVEPRCAQLEPLRKMSAQLRLLPWTPMMRWRQMRRIARDRPLWQTEGRAP